MQHKQNNSHFDKGNVIYSGKTNLPTTILQLGLRHEEQINLLHHVLDAILKEQSVDLQKDIQFCPRCGYEVIRNGTTHSSFNTIFTDHKVPVHRLKCMHCKWTSVPSIKSLFGSNLHPDLVKLQCEHDAKASYTDAKDSLNKLSANTRTVNNPMSVRQVVEKMGNHISNNTNTTDSNIALSAKELIAQVDGGHVKSKSKDKRSFEALTSVVYKPNSIIPGKKKRTSGTLLYKHCAASALDDNGAQIKALTLSSAQKEGLTPKTHITALCDGADNCWNIIDALKPHCGSIEPILDWFHIAKQFQNTRMGENYNLTLAKAKWSLWHGEIDASLEKIQKIKNKVRSQVKLDKLTSLYQYLDNNRDRLVDYNKRYRQGKVFTSQLAESTVDSLINQRCKGKRHMQWSREGLHPVLQLRAAIASNDWIGNWEKYVVDAYTNTAS